MPKASPTTRSPSRRTYNNALREEHAQRTHDRILDAFVEILQDDPDDVTIPMVAARAGVSVPTVYRHFASKDELTKALQARIDARIGAEPTAIPANPEELFEHIRRGLARFDRLEGSLKRLGHIRLARESKRARVVRKLEMLDRALAEPLSRMSTHDRTMLRDVIVVLVSSSAVAAFEEYLGLSGEASAERIEWAVRQLVGGPTRGDDRAGRRKRGS
ncbi:MAG: TetR/AcrR family transcriptional regulator [Deltaproteobacteria bacterium]|nr:TetR/AcrR family transcriptional regulator [Deltaproteobacteria bacterium]